MHIKAGPHLSDEELMQLYQQGDREALAILYERHRPSVHADCQRFVRDWDTARDLTGETFMRVIGNSASFTHQANGSFLGWLRTITRNLCLNHIKSFTVSRAVALDPALPLVEMPADDLFTAEQLAAALGKLSDKQRVCLKLLYFEGMSYEEIARHTGMDAKQVRSAVQNGKLKLQRILRKGNP